MTNDTQFPKVGERESASLYEMAEQGLEKYRGPWGYAEAAHLLRRTTFGPTHEQIKQAVRNGLKAVIEQLFAPLPAPSPPLNPDFLDDPKVPTGQTWVSAPYSKSVDLHAYRYRSLRAWTAELMYAEGVSIREKLTLFWHNHFAVSNVNDSRYVYRHSLLLRERAWGNVRDLVKAIVIDPAMLRFLNGNQNSRLAPNENFARELLELFTIGKGPLAGPGDYTNYTEQDVQAMARALTGWIDKGFFSTDPNLQPGASFILYRHDTAEKPLSHRFNSAVIPNLGKEEYTRVIDIIFQQRETARFICRKLYRWFVFSRIDEQIETMIIEPMASVLIDHDFEIKPALTALLSSEHFYDPGYRGVMIKSPLDHIFSIVKPLVVELPAGLRERYAACYQIHAFGSLMQMTYYDPPQVAGWRPYFQEPQYYRQWINTATYPHRDQFSRLLAVSGFMSAGQRIIIDPLKVIESFVNPQNPNLLIDQLTDLLLPQPLKEKQKLELKAVLINGLPDHEWTTELEALFENPEDPLIAQAVVAKLRRLLEYMLQMPECYLM